MDMYQKRKMRMENKNNKVVNNSVNINWFPGHMAKTRRIIKESLPLVDGVVELVDARIPYSSSNPELDQIIKNKPRIVLLNKCDIADPNATNMWLNHYKNRGIYAIPVDCRTGKGLNKFIPTVNNALSKVIEKNKSKGMENKPLRLMVVGIPNTGKSSFINRIAGNSKAKVADKAGVTRQKQWFAVGKGIELLDTPGVLWPKFDDSAIGDRLAFTGAIKDEITDLQLLSCRMLEVLAVTNPNAICDRYKLESVESLQGWEILELIGKKRGFLIKGGEIDYERTAVMLCDEFRGGKLGKISLELPQ